MPPFVYILILFLITLKESLTEETIGFDVIIFVYGGIFIGGGWAPWLCQWFMMYTNF